MIEFELQYQERLVSDQKQFNYQCRCSFLEVNLNLNFFIKLPEIAMSLSLNAANEFLPSTFVLCFKTDIQWANWEFTQSYPGEPWGRHMMLSSMLSSVSSCFMLINYNYDLVQMIVDEGWFQQCTIYWESDWGIHH